MKTTETLTKLSGETFFELNINGIVYYTSLIQDQDGDVCCYQSVDSYIFDNHKYFRLKDSDCHEEFLKSYKDKKITFYNKKLEYLFVKSFSCGSSVLKDMFTFTNGKGDIYVNYKRFIFRAKTWEFIKTFFGF